MLWTCCGVFCCILHAASALRVCTCSKFALNYMYLLLYNRSTIKWNKWTMIVNELSIISHAHPHRQIPEMIEMTIGGAYRSGAIGAILVTSPPGECEVLRSACLYVYLFAYLKNILRVCHPPQTRDHRQRRK